MSKTTFRLLVLVVSMLIWALGAQPPRQNLDPTLCCGGDEPVPICPPYCPMEPPE